MSCLSIFVDESGDFGPYDTKTPYYIITMLIHDQAKDILGHVQSLDDKIQSLGYEKGFVIHTAPLIRREDVFANESPNKRRSLFASLFFFTIKSPIQYKTFIFEKKLFPDAFSLEGRMAKELSLFIRNNIIFFQKFDNVVLYYDNGQTELNRFFKMGLINCFLSSRLLWNINCSDFDNSPCSHFRSSSLSVQIKSATWNSL